MPKLNGIVTYHCCFMCCHGQVAWMTVSLTIHFHLTSLTHLNPIYQLDIFDLQLTEDSEVFEDGAIGETPGGGSIGTYKELCNIANEMGQPDLIYKFMDLANYQTSLNSRRGAAFGFSRIAKQAGDALKPHLRTLVPKLFRYQYDPNKRIQVGCQKNGLFLHTTLSCVEMNLQHFNLFFNLYGPVE